MHLRLCKHKLCNPHGNEIYNNNVLLSYLPQLLFCITENWSSNKKLACGIIDTPISLLFLDLLDFSSFINHFLSWLLVVHYTYFVMKICYSCFYPLTPVVQLAVEEILPYEVSLIANDGLLCQRVLRAICLLFVYKYCLLSALEWGSISIIHADQFPVISIEFPLSHPFLIIYKSQKVTVNSPIFLFLK